MKDGVLYAIDFMNPAPDTDRYSVGEESFAWIVDTVAKLAVKKVKLAGEPLKEFRWAGFLSGTKTLEKSGTKAAVKKVVKK